MSITQVWSLEERSEFKIQIHKVIMIKNDRIEKMIEEKNDRRKNDRRNRYCSTVRRGKGQSH